MENTQINKDIKEKIYQLWAQYPVLTAEQVLDKLKNITNEVKKQIKR